ncbi:MAG: hypothetical protein WAL84_04400 [Candidatus Dormiibacterota bacterium]
MSNHPSPAATIAAHAPMAIQLHFDEDSGSMVQNGQIEHRKGGGSSIERGSQR